MTDHFEDRHRALRTAAEGELMMFGRGVVSLHDCEAQLYAFYELIGPLVDDLVAAVREMLKFGEHEGECVRDESGKCVLHLVASRTREAVLRGRLAVLDEAAHG